MSALDTGWTTDDVEGRIAQRLADAEIAEAVYHEELPARPAMPALTYQLITKRPLNTHSGPSGIARSRVQVDVWARDKNESARMARDVTETLVGFSGDGIRSITQIFEQSLRDPARPLSRRVIDFEVWHDDPIPAS